MKKSILGIGVLALVAFTVWWLRDVPLDDTARQWLDTTPNDDNPAYAYLLGFGVPATQSPAQQGHELAQRQKVHPELVLPNAYPKLNNTPLLCHPMTAACLLEQQEKKAQAKALISRYQFLIDRYQTFLEFSYFSDNTPPRLNATFPEYNLLVCASRLQSLAWANSAAHRDSAAAPMAGPRPQSDQQNGCQCHPCGKTAVSGTSRAAEGYAGTGADTPDFSRKKFPFTNEKGIHPDGAFLFGRTIPGR